MLIQLAARGTVYGRVSFLEEEESLPCPMLTRSLQFAKRAYSYHHTSSIDFTSGNNPLSQNVDSEQNYNKEKRVMFLNL